MAEKEALKPETPVNWKQRQFVKYVALTKNVPESALRTGFSENYGNFLMRQPKIQTALQKRLDEAGLDDKEIAKLIDEGAHAMLPEKKSKDGKVLQKEHPDFYNRKDYVKMALQVRKDLSPDALPPGGKTININLNIGLATGLYDAGKISKQEFIELKELTHEPVREE